MSNNSYQVPNAFSEGFINRAAAISIAVLFIIVQCVAYAHPSLQPTSPPPVQDSVGAMGQPLGWKTTVLIPSAVMPASPQTRAKVLNALGRSPLHFEKNRGQAAGGVQFLARAPGYQLSLMPNEAMLSLQGQARNDKSSVVRIQWVGDTANTKPAMEVFDPLPAHSNYYISGDPQRWQTGVPHYGKVRYRHIYPGIDWVMYGNPRQLEYDLVVAPGADPSIINLQLSGVDSIRLTEDGRLAASAGGQEVLHSSPTIYQTIDGERRTVEGHYILRESASSLPTIGFSVAAYDRKSPLVIDPVVYLTLVGGIADETTHLGGNDIGLAIAIDSVGNAYITGYTNSNIASGFPVTNTVWNADLAGGADVFITRLDTAGGIAYSTYLGGSATEVGNAIAVDAVGNTYVTGYTNSNDLPNPPIEVKSTAVALDEKGDLTITTASLPHAKVGDYYRFSLAISGAEMSDTSWSIIPIDKNEPIETWMGAAPSSITLTADGILNGTPADDAAGSYQFIVQATVGTVSVRKTFTLNVYNPNSISGTQDAFVAKINANGTLGYLRLLGGTGNESGNGITVDTSGSAYVTGYTTSTDFPGAANAAISGEDAFIVKVASTITATTEPGTEWVYSILSGFAGNDRGQAIVLDQTNSNVYVTGYRKPTASTGEDAFIAKVAMSDVSSISITTHDSLGGTGYERGLAIAQNQSTSDLYITGYTNSSSGIATASSYQQSKKGSAASRDAFVAQYSYGSGFTKKAATYFGGIADDVGYGIAVDSLGNIDVAGSTLSSNFPLLNADDSDRVKREAFLVRLDASLMILDYASFWGGDENDEARGLAIDLADDVYMVGFSNAALGFPSTPDGATSAGNTDAFIAKFSIPVDSATPTLTVQLSGAGSGIVTSAPKGVLCSQTNGILDEGADCLAPLPLGTHVILTAEPMNGSQFMGWGGDASCGATELTCGVDTALGRKVFVIFYPPPTLTIQLLGDGSGSVTSDPTGISCNKNIKSDCSERYAFNTNVVLTAKPIAGSRFTGWAGKNINCGTNTTCSVSMDDAKSVTAEFSTDLRNLSIRLSGGGSGHVASSPEGIGQPACQQVEGVLNTGADCSEDYPVNALITLTATAEPGSMFIGWLDGGYSACNNKSESCSVVKMDQAKQVVATFVKAILLTVEIDKTDGSGSVTINGTKSCSEGCSCSEFCQVAFLPNEQAILVASPSDGSTFKGWDGDCAGSSGTICTIEMNRARTAKSTFHIHIKPPTYILKVRTEVGANNGVVEGGGNYNAGESVTLIATPTFGYKFYQWKSDPSSPSVCDFTFVMPANNLACTAIFIPNTTPDLQITGITAPPVASEARGRTILFKGLTVANTGKIDAKTFKVGLYWLADAIINRQSNISAGSECTFISLSKETDDSSCHGALTLPLNLEAGEYYLGAYVDPSEKVVEGDEGNNGYVIADQRFKIQKLTVTVPRTAKDKVSGTIYSVPPGIDCNSASHDQCAIALFDRTEIKLDVTPAVGLRLSGWSAGCSSISNTGTCAITVGDKIATMTPKFHVPSSENVYSIGAFRKGIWFSEKASVGSKQTKIGWYTGDLKTWALLPHSIFEVATGDGNNDEVADLLVGLSTDSAIWYTRDYREASGSSITQDPAQWIWAKISAPPSTKSLTQLVAGGFNADAKVDLAVLDSDNKVWYTTNLSIWSPLDPLPSSAKITRLMIGNLSDSNSGKANLAVLASDKTVWYTTDLKTWTQFPLPTSPQMKVLTIGDLNLDKKADLVGLDSEGKIRYTSADGKSWTTIPSGSAVKYMLTAVGDLDGDGNADLVSISSDKKVQYTTDRKMWQTIEFVKQTDVFPEE